MTDLALNEKWAELLNESSLPEIKDTYRTNVTAVLLENQEKALMEASPSNIAGGVAGYDPVLISMVRRAAPMLIAFDICGVQPMTMPTGLVFALKSRYLASGTDSGKNTSNQVEALFNEADTSFTGSGNHSSFLGVQIISATASSTATLTIAANANIYVGMPVAGGSIPAGTTIASITTGTPGVDVTVFVLSANHGSGTSTFSLSVGNAAGAGILTATGEGDITAKLGFTIDKVSVTATTFQLASGYSIELAQDMKALHGLDAEAELSHMMSTELVTETNRRVLRTLYNLAKAGAASTTQAGIVDIAADTDGRWSNEKFKGLLFQIEKDANRVAIETKLGKGNVLVCSAYVATALAAAGSLSYAPALAALEQLNGDFTQSTFVGTISGQMKVFVDPYASSDFYMVGYKGSQLGAQGAFYTPYVAATLHRANDPLSFQPLMALKSRAGFVTNPFGGSTFRSNPWYRIAGVKNIL